MRYRSCVGAGCAALLLLLPQVVAGAEKDHGHTIAITPDLPLQPPSPLKLEKADLKTMFADGLLDG